MNFRQFLNWYADHNGLRPCDLLRLLNANGIKCGKNTPNRWLNGKRQPNIFTQKKVAKILKGELIIQDERILIIPSDFEYNQGGHGLSNNLDNSGTLSQKSQGAT